MATPASLERWIVRRGNAHGTNLVDKDQTVIRVYGPGGFFTMMGRWTTLCYPGGSVNALEATDAQIVAAILGDESIYA